MKLRISSDIHLEFGPLPLTPIGEDVLLLAGDIGVYTDGAAYARDYARRTNTPTIYIAGNHEFYRNTKHPAHTIESTLAAIRAIADTEPLLHFLEDDQTEINGTLFLGATLWTDYALQGNPHLAMLAAQYAINDYRLIVDDYNDETPLFTPEKSTYRHHSSYYELKDALSRRRYKQPTVVLTHHLPSPRSIAPEYQNDPLNPAFASNLDQLVADSDALLWVHGHTHASADYLIANTRVVCNPRGYTPHALNPDFNPNLVIEL